MRCALLPLAAFSVLFGVATPAWPQERSAEPIRPLPVAAKADPDRVALGRVLFADPRFSHDDRQSCASCHDLAKGGADGLAHSPGFAGRGNLLNTPTIFNSVHNFRPSWIGREATLQMRLDQVVTGQTELASSWPEIVAKLSNDGAMQRQFQRAYHAGPSRDTISDALRAYLRQLVTPSRFDRYLRGQRDAITADEKLGYAKFKSYGCAACHQGINVGGNMYQKFGTMRALPGLKQDEADLGRFLVTGREEDRHVFRVPSLRNVALTAPYFHNGSVATLEEAVDVMFTYQLGRSASKEDRALIVRFLGSLTGEDLPVAGKARICVAAQAQWPPERAVAR